MRTTLTRRLAQSALILVTALVGLLWGASSPAAAAPTAGPPGGWNSIIGCESGGKNIPNSTSSASGYFQFLDSTWAHYGGTQFSSRAMGASFEQQMTVANRAFAANGLNDWTPSQSCWGHGGGRAVTIQRTPGVPALTTHRTTVPTARTVHTVQPIRTVHHRTVHHSRAHHYRTVRHHHTQHHHHRGHHKR